MSQRFRRPLLPSSGPFTWAYWNALHQEFDKSDWVSLERWQLAFLHSPDILEEIARIIFESYAFAGTYVQVSTQSVWIDGTPQVVGSLPTGTKLARSELADLLLIVNEMTPTGRLVDRLGVLIQGKTGKRHNKLPSNHSTKKERLLLEGLDRSRPLEVFRDVSLTSSSKIGEYTFGTGVGLKDCATYLMMAKEKSWHCPLCTKLGPLQSGWPKTRKCATLDPTSSFEDMLAKMAVRGSVGRRIFDKSSSMTCEWSRLVWDLLGDYQPVRMQGYGGQQRVNISPVVSFAMSGLMNFSDHWLNFNERAREKGLSSQMPPPLDTPNFPEVMRNPPAISVLQIDVTLPYEE